MPNKSDSTSQHSPTVPDSALLYSGPSRTHTETVLVRNAGFDAATNIYVSHRERYVSHDKHVELASYAQSKCTSFALCEKHQNTVRARHFN
jgi:hypothetical protein